MVPIPPPMPRMASSHVIVRLARLVLPLAALAGCHLVDQRSFDRTAGRRPVPPAAPVVPGPLPVPPLLVVRFDTPDPQYRAALATAVDAARRRKPDVLFSVVVLVPPSGTPAQQVAAAEAARGSGRDVAAAIVADGADIGQVELSARAEPGRAVREVRVYVH